MSGELVTPSAHDLPLGHLERCQLCTSTDLVEVLDLGHQAPCDSLLAPHQLAEPEVTFPLRLVRCPTCGLAQLDYVVDPEVVFHPEYPYRSGITATLAQNLHRTARTILDQFPIAPKSLAMDIGSNDGTLLKGFRSQGLRVLGIEATNVAKLAIDDGIETIQAFFDPQVASEIVQQHGRAAVVTATNMFAHVKNLGGLITGVSDVLQDDGLFVTESHYLVDLLETVQYDSIYHEHLKFYSIKPLIQLLSSYGFSVVRVERIPNYGGSIRVFAVKGSRSPDQTVQAIVREEQRAGIYEREVFDVFAVNAIRAKRQLQDFLVTARKSGRRVVGVGCPGRASTLLNFSNVDPDQLPYIAEQSSSLKLGLFLPGTHIPIVDEAQMFEEQPDYALLLSWHYSAPIIEKLRAKGLRSQIVLPLPEVEVLKN